MGSSFLLIFELPNQPTDQMNIDVDKIIFGHPTARDYELMKQPCFLDRLLPDLQNFTPPPNSSIATRNELLKLVDYTATARIKEHSIYDEGLIPHIKELFINAGASPDFIDDVTREIMGDMVPMITKLKYYFNRPRPAQLAPYFDIILIPDFSYFTNNPSYPSGHTCLTAVTCEVLGNHYPEVYTRMQDLIKKVEASRLCLGVHYPSDNDMSRVVAKHVLSNAEFRSKYNL